jgi:hypothetical protein
VDPTTLLEVPVAPAHSTLIDSGAGFSCRARTLPVVIDNGSPISFMDHASGAVLSFGAGPSSTEPQQPVPDTDLHALMRLLQTAAATPHSAEWLALLDIEPAEAQQAEHLHAEETFAENLHAELFHAAAGTQPLVPPTTPGGMWKYPQPTPAADQMQQEPVQQDPPEAEMPMADDSRDSAENGLRPASP